jgi:hypothetical protein
MSIVKRTVLFDRTTDVIRFNDWAYVDTTIGPMGEPFHPNARVSTGTPITDFDPTDEISRIDEMRALPVDASFSYFSGGLQAIGGYQMPRDGK